METQNIPTNYLNSIKKLFGYYKSLGDKAMGQLTEKELRYSPTKDSNNIAVIVKHMRGNMLSRWTDFLTADGEKPWRHRDTEFEDTLLTKKDIMAAWEEGWTCLFAAINTLEENHVGAIIYIRNEGHTVLEAINRQLGHYSYHVGQIVYLARQAKAGEWNSLSIPKGKSKDFNKDKFGQEKGRRHFV
jgi:hypothetical protein